MNEIKINKKDLKTIAEEVFKIQQREQQELIMKQRAKYREKDLKQMRKSLIDGDKTFIINLFEKYFNKFEFDEDTQDDNDIILMHFKEEFPEKYRIYCNIINIIKDNF